MRILNIKGFYVGGLKSATGYDFQIGRLMISVCTLMGGLRKRWLMIDRVSIWWFGKGHEEKNGYKKIIRIF